MAGKWKRKRVKLLALAVLVLAPGILAWAETASLCSEPTITPYTTWTPYSTPTPLLEATGTPRSTNTPSPAFERAVAVVVEVMDGNTIEVIIERQYHIVRYIGIEIPKPVHPSELVEWIETEARAANERLVSGRIVFLEKDVSETDQDGRLLRYVFLTDDNATFVNAEIVKMGYAQASTYLPDVRYQDLFLELQREAQEAERGLWGLSPILATDIPLPPTRTPAPTSTLLVATLHPTRTPYPTRRPYPTPTPYPTVAAPTTWSVVRVFAVPWLVEIVGGVVTAIVVSLFRGLLDLTATERLTRGLLELTRSVIQKMQSATQERLAAFVDRLSAVETGVGGVISGVSLSMLGALSTTGASLESAVIRIGRGLRHSLRKFRAQRWYQGRVAIDPGLIEVALAVTAVVIALPSFIEDRGIELRQSVGFRIALFLGVLIPTITSITLLDLHAKGKGSRSRHILLSPIADGPFFFLGWSILIGLVAIGIAVVVTF